MHEPYAMHWRLSGPTAVCCVADARTDASETRLFHPTWRPSAFCATVCDVGQLVSPTRQGATRTTGWPKRPERSCATEWDAECNSVGRNWDRQLRAPGGRIYSRIHDFKRVSCGCSQATAGSDCGCLLCSFGAESGGGGNGGEQASICSPCASYPSTRPCSPSSSFHDLRRRISCRKASNQGR